MNSHEMIPRRFPISESRGESACNEACKEISHIFDAMFVDSRQCDDNTDRHILAMVRKRQFILQILNSDES